MDYYQSMIAIKINQRIHLLRMLGIIFGIALSVSVNAQAKYSKIVPQELKFDVNSQNLETLKIIPIYSPKKKKIYELSITSISLDQKSVHLVQAFLKAVDNSDEDKYEPNILNPDRWGHGEGSWIFRPQQFNPNNNTSKNFGTSRIFKMRQMRIIISIANLNFNEDYSGIKSMTIKINIKPDLSKNSRPIIY